MTAKTGSELFFELVDGVGKLVAGDTVQVDRLANLYAQDAHVVYFGDPENPLRGRDALRKHFSGVPGHFSAARFKGFHAENIHVHETGDPEVVVAEFAYVSDGADDGPPVNLRCCFVIRARDGEIVETRDYVLGSV